MPPRVLQRRRCSSRILDWSSSSDKEKEREFNVQDILLEAENASTHEVYVFAIWQGEPVHSGSWIPYEYLNDMLKSWWISERDRFLAAIMDLCVLSSQV